MSANCCILVIVVKIEIYSWGASDSKRETIEELKPSFQKDSINLDKRFWICHKYGIYKTNISEKTTIEDLIEISKDVEQCQTLNIKYNESNRQYMVY